MELSNIYKSLDYISNINMGQSTTTINKFLEDYPALGTGMKGVVICAVLVAAAAVTSGVAVGTAVAVAGIAVGAPIVATAAHALEESSFAKKKPVLQKACKFVRVACETSLAIGAGLVASPYLLGISAGVFVAAKAMQKRAEYNISNNVGGDNSISTMAKNLGSGIASVCAPLALGSAFSLAAELGNIFSSAATPDIVDKGKIVVARTGSALFAASTAAFSGVCYLSSASLGNAGFKKAASAISLIGHVALAAAAVSASVTAGFAVSQEIYHPSVDDVTGVGSASAAVGGLVAGVATAAVSASVAVGGFFGLNNFCGNIVQKDIENVMGNNTKDKDRGVEETIGASQISHTKKDRTDTLGASNTQHIKDRKKSDDKVDSNIPSRSPRPSSASQFGNLKFNDNKDIQVRR